MLAPLSLSNFRYEKIDAINLPLSHALITKIEIVAFKKEWAYRNRQKVNSKRSLRYPFFYFCLFLFGQFYTYVKYCILPVALFRTKIRTSI